MSMFAVQPVTSVCVCVLVRVKEKKGEREIIRIIRVFCEFMEMAAHKSSSLRKNLHLGRHLWKFALVFESKGAKMFCVRELCSRLLWRSDPLSRLDYIPKRKSEHPQRGSSGGRWRDSETEKRESQPFDVNPVIFLRHPVLAPLSLSFTNRHTQTHAHLHTRKVIKIPHSLRSWLNPVLFSNLGF